MALQASISGSDGSPELNTVFIDTNLGTNLITVVSSDETFSDLKKKVLREHVQCFPHIGEIKIVAFKVKRNGKFYRFLQSMLVKNAFHGETGGWFVVTDINPCSKGMKSDTSDRICDKPGRIPLEERAVETRKCKKRVLECGKSKETSVDLLLDQSLEDDPKSEPSAKRRRKQEKGGDEDLPKDDTKCLRSSSLENGTRNNEHQNLVSGQNDRVDKGEFSPEILPKSAQDDLQSKAKEGITGSKLLEASEPVDPPKLSKKKKNSKKTKDLDTISTSCLATDKEINDVIQNVVESHVMGKDEVGSESMDEKSRKIWKGNENIGKNNVGDMLWECGKDTTTENNNQGIQSVEVAQKLESKSKKRGPEGVIPSSPSRSGRANEVTNYLEASCQNSGINFNDYCMPKKQDLETLGSSEMLVDEAPKIDGDNGTVKAKNGKKKKKKKKKKHDAHLDGPSSDLKTPAMLEANPNKEPSPEKPLEFNKVNSVIEETLGSNDAKPTGTINGSNNKKVENHDHNVGRKASVITNGEVVNSLKKESSLEGVLGGIFKDDGEDASSNVDDNSEASTRTPSDASLSSDYSDGESNADSDSSQNGSCSSKREGGTRKTKIKPIAPGMTLEKILRSSSTFKKAKLTASQLQLEDPESLFISDNLAQK